MASENAQGRTGQVLVRPAALHELTDHLCLQVERREEVRVWDMSGVERLHCGRGHTAILKYAVAEFAIEPVVLRHAAAHGVPVPMVGASTIQPDGSMVMIMEDLGPQTRQADLKDAASAAAAIHACPALPGRPIVDSARLASLPGLSLGWLRALQTEQRWLRAQEIEDGLTRLARVARQRAQGAQMPPYGMCHSEFHPTSLYISDRGTHVLDWARAFTGPGLLDLVSWQGTPKPLDLPAVAELIDAYVTAGGPPSALAARGGLPAHVWASGWFKLWIVEWFLQMTYQRADPENDDDAQRAIGRHLDEAVQCLS